MNEPGSPSGGRPTQELLQHDIRLAAAAAPQDNVVHGTTLNVYVISATAKF